MLYSEASHSGTLMYGSEGSHSGTLMYCSDGSHSGTLMYGSEGGTLMYGSDASHSGTLMYCSEGSVRLQMRNQRISETTRLQSSARALINRRAPKSYRSARASIFSACACHTESRMPERILAMANLFRI